MRDDFVFDDFVSRPDNSLWIGPKGQSW